MIWVIRVVIALVAVTGLVASVGWMLPVNHEVSRRAEFPKPVEDVDALVATVRDYAAARGLGADKPPLVGSLAALALGLGGFAASWESASACSDPTNEVSPTSRKAASPRRREASPMNERSERTREGRSPDPDAPAAARLSVAYIVDMITAAVLTS